MGCFFPRKTYIEEKIEECESYLKLQTCSISRVKQAFFQLNDGDIIKEKALRRAIINLELEYSNHVANYVVFPFLQSFAIGTDPNKDTEYLAKESSRIFELAELLKRNIESDIYDFNKIICVLFLLSNDKSAVKASEIFKLFCGANQIRMSRVQIEDAAIFIFQSVVFYSLIFSELSSKKIALLNSKINESIEAEKEVLIEWLFTDFGEDEISEDYFVNRIRQYEVYLGYSLMNPRGIRRRVMSFVYKRYEEIEDFINRKGESDVENLENEEQKRKQDGNFALSEEEEKTRPIIARNVQYENKYSKNEEEINEKDDLLRLHNQVKISENETELHKSEMIEKDFESKAENTLNEEKKAAIFEEMEGRKSDSKILEKQNKPEANFN